VIGNHEIVKNNRQVQYKISVQEKKGECYGIARFRNKIYSKKGRPIDRFIGRIP